MGANGTADTVAGLPTYLFIALDAVAALGLVVVDLGLWVALRTKALDQVVSWQAAAGANKGVPDLVDLAVGSADAVNGVVDLSGRAKAAGIANEVVPFLAYTLPFLVNFVGVAGRGAEPQIFDIALVAGTCLGDRVVGGVQGAGVAKSILHFEVLRQADAFPDADVIDVLGSTGDSADAESLIVDLIPFALSTDTVDRVEAGSTAALPVDKNFIGSAAYDAHTVALLSVAVGADAALTLSIVGRISFALLADAFDSEVGASATALASNDVVYFVGEAGNTADA